MIKNKRKKRVRARLSDDKARLSVFRSSDKIYAQIIREGKTLASINSTKVKPTDKISEARETGLLIAQKAKEVGIEEVVFDRGQYAYHGRVKALAEGAREGGLKF